MYYFLVLSATNRLADSMVLVVSVFFRIMTYARHSYSTAAKKIRNRKRNIKKRQKSLFQNKDQYVKEWLEESGE